MLLLWLLLGSCAMSINFIYRPKHLLVCAYFSFMMPVHDLRSFYFRMILKHTVSIFMAVVWIDLDNFNFQLGKKIFTYWQLIDTWDQTISICSAAEAIQYSHWYAVNLLDSILHLSLKDKIWLSLRIHDHVYLSCC